jgi:hypothetical protein
MKPVRIIFPIHAVKRGFSLSFQTFEEIISEAGYKGLIKVLAGLIVFWHLYVPFHELLHVAGCLLGGGQVTSLTLKPQYGGSILGKLFSFVVPESEYAGRLTGFTAPNGWVYAFVDFLPYTISLFGLTVIMYCRRKRAAFLLGLGFILAFVPFMSVPGDYYEAVSLVTTRMAESMDPGLRKGVLVSDDLFRSLKGLAQGGNLNWAVGICIIAGIMASVYLALMTFALQVKIGDVFFNGRSKTNPKSRKDLG